MRRPFAALTVSLAAALLTACGFAPMHGTGGGQTTFNDVAVVVTDGRSEQDRAAGYRFAQHMRARTNAAGASAYTLTVVPSVQRVGLGLSAQDLATRYDRNFRANWVLTETATGTIVQQGRASDRATFTADIDPYRLASNDEQAMRVATRAVADRVLADVALALQGVKTAGATTAP